MEVEFSNPQVGLMEILKVFGLWLEIVRQILANNRQLMKCQILEERSDIDYLDCSRISIFCPLHASCLFRY